MVKENPNSRRRAFLEKCGTTFIAAAGVGSGGVSIAAANPRFAEFVELTYGVASGEVTDQSAVIWARADESAVIHVECDKYSSFEQPKRRKIWVEEETDYTGQVRFNGLNSQTRYYYRVWAATGKGAPGMTDPPDEPEQGTFITAPKDDEDAAVKFAYGADTYGYGADPIEPPFPALASIAEMQPDFFIHLGDTIYSTANTPAGSAAAETTPQEAFPIYRRKHKEMRDPAAIAETASPSYFLPRYRRDIEELGEELALSAAADTTYLQDLLEETSVYATWDDHDVYNGFDRTHFRLPVGRKAFFEYWPIDDHPTVTGTDSNRLYRSFRWGAHLEVFILDTRQYRDPQEVTEDKTMLGDDQLAWLKESLEKSDATFKLIASPSTMGILSKDGWSTSDSNRGYEDELSEIIETIEGLKNVVVLSGDIHKAQVASYDPNENGTAEFYEASACPIGAPGGGPNPLYQALNPTEYYARGRNFFNFGVVEVDEKGERLTLEIRNEEGEMVFWKPIEAEDSLENNPPELSSPELVDTCENLTMLAGSSDTENLEVHEPDPQNFVRPDGSPTYSTIWRSETTADTALVYAPDSQITDLYTEFYWYEVSTGVDLKVYESTDEGSSWSPVPRSVESYSGGNIRFRERMITCSSFSDGADQVKLVITGSPRWAALLGHVEINIV